MSIEVHSLYHVSWFISLSFQKVTAPIFKVQLQAVFSSREANNCIHTHNIIIKRYISTW